MSDTVQSEPLPFGSPAAVAEGVRGGGARGTETLALVLRQATTCLDGLGSLVHLFDRDAGVLRLVAASGLAEEASRA